jgi:hypothetical protein
VPPATRRRAGAGTGSAAYPLDPQAAGTTVPFRYLGRVDVLGEAAAGATGAGRVDVLTAVGYGDPLFAAYYPSCRNVFGLHDGDGTEVADGLRYHLVGWYADEEQDYLRELVRPASPEDPRETVRRVAGWVVPDSRDRSVPERMLCYARLEFTGASTGGSTAPADPPVTVAVGNTGAQALGAYLADVLGESRTSAVQDQLAAMLLAPRLPQGGPELAARFDEAVHESGFVAVPAGTLWTVRRVGGEGTPAGQPPADPVPVDRLNHALNALNQAQQAYDRAVDEIGSLCGQLFADWYRYQLCAYPPVGTGEDYPDIDELRYFIERRSLPELERRVRAAGVLALRRDDSGSGPGDGYPVATDTDPGSLAAAVAQAAGEVRAALGASDGGYRLQQLEAPRFWEPAEPAVLLAGEAMAPTLRHGRDGRLRPDGLLDCQLASDVPVPPKKPDHAAALLRLIDGIARPEGGAQIGFQAWDPLGWDPLALAWEVEVLPASGADTGAYRPDFLLSRYALAEDEPELHWRAGEGVVRTAAMVYSGTGILTPHAQELHVRRLAGYVMDIFQRERDLPAMSDEDAAAYVADPDNLRRLTDWQQSKPPPPDGAPDPVRTALLALARLRTTASLSLSLAGFNEAMLARRQTLQLDVADPLGFDDYRRFTERVRGYVQGSGPAAPAIAGGRPPPYLRGHNRSAPQPGNDFSPVRSGALRLRRLRLIDTFGRVCDPQWSRVVPARQLPGTSDGELVTLPPRVVQPARLAFRWLSADAGDQQLTELASEAPICGWVLANHLDESLMFHSGGGAALGALDRDGRWRSAPGAPAMTPEQISDPHLRRLVTYLRGRGAAFLRAMHGALDSALERVDPAGPAGYQDVALLVGRPLAVVRASLNLELRGLPAAGQGWADLRADLRRDGRQRNGFPEVRVPVRIGDHRRLGDGLVGYWKETGDTYEDTFYVPLSEPLDDPSIRTHAGGEAPIEQSLTAPPQVLTMLVDPRGAVHATCGVLPVKTIDIPAEQYVDALRRIEVTFAAGPVLTPAAAVGLPLPAQPGHSWSWVERTTTGWHETEPAPTAVAGPTGPLQVRDGWLKLSRRDEAT